MFSVRACVLETVMKTHCGAPKRQKWCQHTAALCPVSAGVKLQSLEIFHQKIGLQYKSALLSIEQDYLRDENIKYSTDNGVYRNIPAWERCYFDASLFSNHTKCPAVTEFLLGNPHKHTAEFTFQSPATACLYSSPRAPGTHSLQVANCSSRWSQNTERNWWWEKKEPFISTPLCPGQKWEDSGYARVCMQSRGSQLKTGSYIQDYAGLLERISGSVDRQSVDWQWLNLLGTLKKYSLTL